eukprot:2613105-Pleurochrysis_carterae.AAC.1
MKANGQPMSEQDEAFAQNLRMLMEEDEQSLEYESSEFEVDDDVQWAASTVMCMHSIVEDKLIAYFHKYLNKESNKGRIFTPSMTQACVAQEEEAADRSQGTLSTTDADTAKMIDREFRQCGVAKETNTLNKLYGMLEDAMDGAVDKFIEKYQYFGHVSTTKEDFSMLKFDEGDFHKEHVECVLLDEDDAMDRTTIRRLAVFVILQAPEKGGQFEFAYQ